MATTEPDPSVSARAGSNAPAPVRSLRDWLDHLAARDRLAVIKPNVALKFELAAIAKRFDGQQATLFPHPGGHPIPVVSGLVSDRGWIADAMGVEVGDVLARFQHAALNPLPWREVKSAPVQEIVHREVDLGKQLPLPVHNEHDNGPYITAGLCIARNPKTGVQNVSLHRLQLSGPNRLGALLLPPDDPTCAAAVIFFNNVGYLGMCGHGTIGLVASLRHLGRLEPGAVRIDTPVGPVDAELNADGSVSVSNVPSYRKARQVPVRVPGIGEVAGDVAWGGNWFFLMSEHGQDIALKRVDALTDYAWRVREAVNTQGHPEVDHVELYGAPTVAGAQSRDKVVEIDGVSEDELSAALSAASA